MEQLLFVIALHIAVRITGDFCCLSFANFSGISYYGSIMLISADRTVFSQEFSVYLNFLLARPNTQLQYIHQAISNLGFRNFYDSLLSGLID